MDTNSTILAIDLGKFKAVLCWFDPASGEVVFRSVRTDPDSFRHELTRQPVNV